MLIYTSTWSLESYFLPDAGKQILQYQQSTHLPEVKPHLGKGWNPRSLVRYLFTSPRLQCQTHCQSPPWALLPNAALSPRAPAARGRGDAFQTHLVRPNLTTNCLILVYTYKKESTKPLKSQSIRGHFPFQSVCVWNSVVELSTERERKSFKRQGNRTSQDNWLQRGY